MSDQVGLRAAEEDLLPPANWGRRGAATPGSGAVWTFGLLAAVLVAGRVWVAPGVGGRELDAWTTIFLAVCVQALPFLVFLLVPPAVALLVLGAAGLRREWRNTDDTPGGSREHGDLKYGDDHGHDHSRGPRTAWLPVLAVLIAPPALGSFTAARDTGRAAPPPAAPAAGFGPLPPNGAPVTMTMGEFIGRAYEAQTGDPDRFEGVPVRLTGFVTPDGKSQDGWQVTRLKIACCAGDAIPFPVRVRGLPGPPTDAWVQVVGVWKPPDPHTAGTAVQELSGRSLKRIKKPKNPYE